MGAQTFSARHVRARSSDPSTSHDAAVQVELFYKGIGSRLVEALRHRRGATVDELAETLCLQSQQVNKRLPELAIDGLVQATTIRRLGNSGRAQRVWVAL